MRGDSSHGVRTVRKVNLFLRVSGILIVAIEFASRECHAKRLLENRETNQQASN